MGPGIDLPPAPDYAVQPGIATPDDVITVRRLTHDQVFLIVAARGWRRVGPVNWTECDGRDADEPLDLLLRHGQLTPEQRAGFDQFRNAHTETVFVMALLGMEP